VQREISAEGLSYRFDRPRPGVLLITSRGQDRGEVGVAPLDEIGKEIARFGKLSVFIDARGSNVLDQEVAATWMSWLTQHADDLTGVTVLADSGYMQFVLKVQQHLSRTARFFHVYEDLGQFENALHAEAPSAQLRD
jgi:hypothetical protein